MYRAFSLVEEKSISLSIGASEQPWRYRGGSWCTYCLLSEDENGIRRKYSNLSRAASQSQSATPTGSQRGARRVRTGPSFNGRKRTPKNFDRLQKIAIPNRPTGLSHTYYEDPLYQWGLLFFFFIPSLN